MLRSSVLILGTVVLLLSTASAQQQDSVMIRQFRGIDNVSSDFTVGFEYARNVHNYDLGRNVGALTRRFGYNIADSIASGDGDTVMSPYGVYLPDGRQCLVYVGNRPGYSYGRVVATAMNSDSISSWTILANRWGTKYQTTYAMQNGFLFMANGQNRMIAWEAINSEQGGAWSSYIRPVPPYAPGELEIYPLSDTAGGGILYGDYMWAVVLADSVVDTATNQTNGRQLSSYVTTKMRVDSARVFVGGLYNYFVSDSLISAAPVRYVKLYRTKTNPGPLTKFTTLYFTGDSVKFPGGSASIVDDVPDASLSSTDKFVTNDREPCERGYGVKAGQPQIKLTQIIGPTGPATGMARGTQGLHILKWAWACTYVDTSLDAESDTGRRVELDSVNLTILTGGDSTGAKRVDLYLPKPNSTYSHMGINIYRAPIYSIIDSSTTTGLVVKGQEKWRKFFTSDTTITGLFRMIGSAKVSDSVFVDTFSTAQWSAGQILRQNRPPSGINNLTSYGGRIFGSAGSRLYLSLLDSGSFAQMRFIEINRDNGDEITGVVAGRRAMRIFEGRSSYNVYQDADGDWSRSEISSGVGCIAPRSIAQSALGTYYLSNKGVILENDGPYIERTQATQLISAKINNFDNLSVAAKRNAVGICVDHKYLLCIGDTTYVWDEKAQGWGTWSMTFSGATLYGVDANIDFIRPDTMYFVKAGSRVLYRYRGSLYDNGLGIRSRWLSAPILFDNQDKTISAIGIWKKNGRAGDEIRDTIFNESGVALAVRVDTSLSARYNRLSIGSNMARGFQIKIDQRELVEDTLLVNTIIDGIDLYYHRQGKVGE